MSDLATALVKHCRADSTLCGATCVGSANRILPYATAGGPYPELSIVQLGTNDGRGSPYLTVRFSVKGTVRSAVSATQTRLHTLFHNKAGYTLASGTPALYCVQSMRMGCVGPDKYDDGGPWESEAEYEFQIAGA